MEFEHLDSLLKEDVYGSHRTLDNRAKFTNALKEVTSHHYRNCKPYRILCNKRKFAPDLLNGLEELPYLPTSLYKDELLVSINVNDVFREVKSSATSSGTPSRIGLDKKTSRRQIRCFNKTIINRIGNERYNFIIIDEPDTIKGGGVVSARSSTIRSLLFCAGKADTCIVRNGRKMTLDLAKMEDMLKKAEELNEKTIIFGFTFILYKYAVKALMAMGKTFNLKNTKVLHIGGWKKLEAEKVSPEKLINDCCEVFGVAPENVIDLYGFTEQAGLIYPTCEEGYRHTPMWGDVIVRDMITLEALPIGEEGLLQFITPIETSYPGHSVLTDDIGVILKEDNCACGRKGKVFKTLRRAANTEMRGCGDIMGDCFI